MCGRFALLAPASQIADVFGLIDVPDLVARHNIAPTQEVFVITGREGARRAEPMRWGLVPSWAKDTKAAARLINARSETAASKPSFRSAFSKRRCLVPTDGFYEWQREGKLKLPWRIGLRDVSPFAMAGLWETFKQPDDSWFISFTVLTTQANALVARVHDRMPCILPPEAWPTWLDPDQHDADTLQALLQPLSPRDMAMWRVSTDVNNARNDDARCSAPLEGDAAAWVDGATLEA